MTRTPRWVLALVCVFAGGPLVAQRPDDLPAPTRTVRFVPPTALPARVQSGNCSTTSLAAGYRTDAFRCVVPQLRSEQAPRLSSRQAGDAIYDPCFSISRVGSVLCDVDPRDPSSGTVVTLTGRLPAPGHASDAGNRAWFIELTDGSTCRPVTGTPRDVDGAIEMYSCQYGSAGIADAVLGDLDASAPVWTIQKVLLNKKIEPMTIKSLMIAAVKTVWQ